MKNICAMDHIARVEEHRRRFIRESVSNGIAHVAMVGGKVVGYAVLEHSFFTRGFIAMLLIDPGHRHSGIGSVLVRHVENLCGSDRIFTSTNESNRPMQALLEKLGYTRSGIIEDLDPGDPELIYSRHLTRRKTV